MKYKIGDILLIKNCQYQSRNYGNIRADLPPAAIFHEGYLPDCVNTLGIITAVEKHADIFTIDSTENDNGYLWYSQVDGKQYYFYENEVEGEVVV